MLIYSLIRVLYNFAVIDKKGDLINGLSMMRCTLKYFVLMNELFCEIVYAFLIKSYANVSNCLCNAKDFKAFLRSMGFEVTHSAISVNSNPSISHKD